MFSSRTAFPSSLLALAAVVAFCTTSAHALTTEEILNYTGPDRQKVLEEGARKEGTVVIYSGMIVNQLLRPLTEAFEKKYPFIRTKYYRGDGNQVIAKLNAEIRANALVADIVEGSGMSAAAGGSGVVLPFTSPLFEALPKEDIAPDRTWAATRFRYIATGYNTKYIAKGDAPKNYDDLLDPRWKGKMAWHANSDASGALVTISSLRVAWGEEKTDAYLAKLAKQDIAPLAVSNRQVVDQMIWGEYWIGIGISAHHPIISARQGAPAATVMFDPNSEPERFHPGAQRHETSPRGDAVRRFHPVERGTAHAAGGRLFPLQSERRAVAEPQDDRTEERRHKRCAADLRPARRAHAEVRRALQQIFSLRTADPRSVIDGRAQVHGPSGRQSGFDPLQGAHRWCRVKPRLVNMTGPQKMKQQINILSASALAVAMSVICAPLSHAQDKNNMAPSFQIVEASIDDIQAAYKSGKLTARQLVQAYLDRIDGLRQERSEDQFDHHAQSARAGRRRQAGRCLQALRFCRPAARHSGLVKDEIDTAGMPTTLGTLVFKDYRPPRDAFVVEQLRKAGAIILGKTTLSEYAAGDTYGSMFGVTRNPYDLERTVGGSSGGSGAALAANFPTLALGEETLASIRRPGAWNAVVACARHPAW